MGPGLFPAELVDSRSTAGSEVFGRTSSGVTLATLLRAVTVCANPGCAWRELLSSGSDGDLPGAPGGLGLGDAGHGHAAEM